MAIPFLNHLDLRSVSELQNAILHKTTTTTASNVEGKFIYDTGTNTLQYYNGSAWISLDGTDTGITSVTLDSDGNATSGNTIIQNGTLTLSFDGASSEYVNGQGNLVTFPSIPTVNDGTLTVQGTGVLGGTGTFTANDADNVTINISHDNTSRTDTNTFPAQLDFGDAFDVVSSVTTNATGHVTAINLARFQLPDSDDTTYDLESDQSGNDVVLLLNGSDASQDVVKFVAGTNITLTDDGSNEITIDAANQGTVTGTGTANTVPKWSTGGTGIEDSSISDDGTTVTIGGNLDVQGTTTTIDSTTVAIGDNMMKYAKDNTANASDIGWYGKIVSSGTKYPGMWYDASTGVSTPKFSLGIATTEPAGTGTIATTGTLIADLEGNAVTATRLETSRNFSITGDITASAVSFNGAANVVLNANIDANVVGATELNVSGNGTSGYLLASDGDGSFSWVAAGAAPNDATITLNAGDGLDGGGAFTLNQSSNETITFSAENASTTNKGVVELATCAEVLTGTDGSRVVTPDTLACKSVTATISAASVSGANLYAEINHGLGTEDVMVELFDATTKETVFALVERKTKAGTNSTSKVTIYFSAVPTNNIEVLITSLKGATTGTVAYS
jgi:hypothetical protein